MAAFDSAFVKTRQKNYQVNKETYSAIVYQPNPDSMGNTYTPKPVSVDLGFQQAETNVFTQLLSRENTLTSAHVDVLETYSLFFGPVETTDFSRLNSNIYKNIFPEVITDLGYINDILDKTATSTEDVIQVNHGLELYDAVYLDDEGKYQRAIAEDSEKVFVQGVVSRISSDDVFTLMNTGRVEYVTLNHDDTSVLYLSDKYPGKLVHYSDIENMIYVPVAIYTKHGLIVNIQQGSTGAPLSPYSGYEESFEPYTETELNDVVNQVVNGVMANEE